MFVQRTRNQLKPDTLPSAFTFSWDEAKNGRVDDLTEQREEGEIHSYLPNTIHYPSGGSLNVGDRAKGPGQGIYTNL